MNLHLYCGIATVVSVTFLVLTHMFGPVYGDMRDAALPLVFSVGIYVAVIGAIRESHRRHER